MAEDRPRFTVEKTPIKGYGVGSFHIRYSPPKRQNEDGSTTLGLSFPMLIAGVMLDEQKAVLEAVCDVLNASTIGR